MLNHSLSLPSTSPRSDLTRETSKPFHCHAQFSAVPIFCMQMSSPLFVQKLTIARYVNETGELLMPLYHHLGCFLICYDKALTIWSTDKLYWMIKLVLLPWMKSTHLLHWYSWTYNGSWLSSGLFYRFCYWVCGSWWTDTTLHQRFNLILFNLVSELRSPNNYLLYGPVAKL